MYDQKCELELIKLLRIERNKQNTTILEDWQEFTSLILMTKITKKLSKMWGENWKDLFCKMVHTGITKVAAKQEIASQKIPKRFMVEKWNLMNAQGHEWNLLDSQYMKIALQAKVSPRWPVTIWFTNLFLCLKRWEFRMQKLQWTRNGKSSRQLQHGNWEVKSKKDFMLDAQRENKKVHFATVMDICHFKNTELKPKLQKYNNRTVLRGDIVTDDSWAYAVFSEQGSSASKRQSQGCCCEITRLWRTSSGRSVSLHSTGIGGHSHIAQNSKVRMSRHMDTSSTTEMADILGKHRRPCGTSRTKSMRTSTCWSLVGKTVRRHVLGSWMVKK